MQQWRTIGRNSRSLAQQQAEEVLENMQSASEQLFSGAKMKEPLNTTDRSRIPFLEAQIAPFGEQTWELHLNFEQ